MKRKLIPVLVLAIMVSPLCANSNDNVDPDILFTCFRQGARGNCASIALIKAAINVFGVNGVFSEQPLSDSSIEVTLKNGKKMTLLLDDLNKARIAADFKPQAPDRSDILDYAVKCYAVMAKMRQEIEGLETFKDGLEKLGKGYHTPTVYLLLGLENNVIRLKRFSNVNEKCGIVAWRTKHAVFSCLGNIDDHGKKKDLKVRYYGRFQLVS